MLVKIIKIIWSIVVCRKREDGERVGIGGDGVRERMKEKENGVRLDREKVKKKEEGEREEQRKEREKQKFELIG